MFFSFPLDGCVDGVVHYQTNYQRYKYVCFLQYHIMTVTHFMNVERVC